jgi:hypothetical protein
MMGPMADELSTGSDCSVIGAVGNKLTTTGRGLSMSRVSRIMRPSTMLQIKHNTVTTRQKDVQLALAFVHYPLRGPPRPRRYPSNQNAFHLYLKMIINLGETFRCIVREKIIR